MENLNELNMDILIEFQFLQKMHICSTLLGLKSVLKGNTEERNWLILTLGNWQLDIMLYILLAFH